MIPKRIKPTINDQFVVGALSVIYDFLRCICRPFSKIKSTCLKALQPLQGDRSFLTTKSQRYTDKDYKKYKRDCHSKAYE